MSEYAYCGHVTCALMSEKGNIYSGININSKCALGNCAEQAAILDMLKHGESEIKKYCFVFCQRVYILSLWEM